MADYGAPIGFNLAVADPGRITAIISQNGNASEEGLGEGPWAPLRAYWKQPSVAIRDSIKERMSLDGVREAYFRGVPDVSRIEPEAYWLDAALLAQPGMMGMQVDLKLDYKANPNAIPCTSSTSGAPASVARHLGQERQLLRSAWRASVPAGRAQRGVKFLNARHFAGNQRG